MPLFFGSVALLVALVRSSGFRIPALANIKFRIPEIPVMIPAGILDSGDSARNQLRRLSTGIRNIQEYSWQEYFVGLARPNFRMTKKDFYMGITHVMLTFQMSLR